MFYIGRQWFIDLEINPLKYKKYCLPKRTAKSIPDVQSAEKILYSDITKLIKLIEKKLSILEDTLRNVKSFPKDTSKQKSNSTEEKPAINQSDTGKLR